MDEIKKPLGAKTYVDGLGYMRFSDSDLLVSRWVARKNIYFMDRRKYPLKFGSYIVHHKNGNKLDNSVENLELLKRKDHEAKHGIINEKDIWKKLIIWSVVILAIIWLAVFILGYFHEEDKFDSDAVICNSDYYDCSDFNSCEEARFVLDSCESDIHHLDGDENGVPCESLCS